MDCQLADVIVIWWCTCQLVWHVDWVSAMHPPLFWPFWWLNITYVILPMTCQQMLNQYIDRVLADMSPANSNNVFWVVILSVIMYICVNNRKISARCSCRIWWHARVYTADFDDDLGDAEAIQALSNAEKNHDYLTSRYFTILTIRTYYIKQPLFSYNFV